MPTWWVFCRVLSKQLRKAYGKMQKKVAKMISYGVASAWRLTTCSKLFQVWKIECGEEKNQQKKSSIMVTRGVLSNNMLEKASVEGGLKISKKYFHLSMSYETHWDRQFLRQWYKLVWREFRLIHGIHQRLPNTKTWCRFQPWIAVSCRLLEAGFVSLFAWYLMFFHNHLLLVTTKDEIRKS